jgi:hypothetical protein
MADQTLGREQWEKPILTALLKLPAIDVAEAVDEQLATAFPDAAPRANALAVVAIVAVAATVAKSSSVLERLTLEERAALAMKVREVRGDEALAKALAGPAVGAGIDRVMKIHSVAEVINNPQALAEIEAKLGGKY